MSSWKKINLLFSIKHIINIISLFWCINSIPILGMKELMFGEVQRIGQHYTSCNWWCGSINIKCIFSNFIRRIIRKICRGPNFCQKPLFIKNNHLKANRGKVKKKIDYFKRHPEWLLIVFTLCKKHLKKRKKNLCKGY